MIRLIPNYGNTRRERGGETGEDKQGLTYLICLSNKPQCTEIVKSRSGQQLMEGICVIVDPMNPGTAKEKKYSAAICWHGCAKYTSIARRRPLSPIVHSLLFKIHSSQEQYFFYLKLRTLHSVSTIFEW